jgi:DNA adenine methylase
METLLSPLRYPGSKAGLIDYVSTLINENLLTGCHFCECHAGGASLGLGLLANGVITKLTLIEKDPLIYAFWKAITCSPDQLCEKIRNLSISLCTWRRFQKYRDPSALRNFGILELGLAGLFFNRTNFSGVLAAGPIGGMQQKSIYKIGCRFNKDELIKRIEAISNRVSDISVVYSDAVTFLLRRADRLSGDSLSYLDPPYYIQGERLYRYHYSERQHQRLASFICAQQFPWLVSYDRHPVIRKMFDGQKIVPITLNYVVKQSRRVEEFLISNVALPEPLYTEMQHHQEQTRQTAYAC